MRIERNKEQIQMNNESNSQLCARRVANFAVEWLLHDGFLIKQSGFLKA